MTRGLQQRLTGLGLVMGLICTGCSTTGAGQTAFDRQSLEEVLSVLRRPLPGPFVALYRLKVPSTGGLRLSVIADGGRGRMTVSENFGGAIVVAGWDENGGSQVFDLKEGCRLEGRRAVGALGLGNLPLDRAVLLLGGRLPVLEGDLVRQLGTDQLVEISSEQWWSVAELAIEPSRISALRGDDWSISLDHHTSSVPGGIRIEMPSGDWAELELVRLQWEFSGDLPSLPDLPLCGQ